MDTDSFIVYVKHDICKDIAEDVKGRFDTSNFELDRSLPKIRNKKGIRSGKVELDGQRMKKLVGLTAKTYSYLIENNQKDKKATSTTKCIIERRLEIQDYKNCLEAAQIKKKKIDIKSDKLIFKIQQRF